MDARSSQFRGREHASVRQLPPAVGSPQVPAAETHLDYLSILYRRRWLAATVFVLVVGTVIVNTFTGVPIYEARVQLLIDPENPNILSFKEVLAPDKPTNDYYQTQYRILQSRALARRVIDELQLWDPPQAVPAPSQDSNIIATIRSVFRVQEPAEPPPPDETAAQSAAIDRFLSQLSVTPIRNSRLVEVRYSSPDPKLAARAANALATQYIRQNLEVKFVASKEAVDWLGQRLAEQRKQVENAELTLQRYREQNDAVSLEERQNIVVQKLADLNAAVTRAKTERIQKEAAYMQLRAIQSDRAAIESLPAVLANPFIQQQRTELADLQKQQAQLNERLGDRHPDMVKIHSAVRSADAKLQNEIAKVVQGIGNEYLSAQAQEKALVEALEQQKREALALNRKEIDYGVLQREAITSRQVFDSLMQRLKETGISGELKSSNVRVIDPAEEPRTPVQPEKIRSVLRGSLAGAVVAILAVFLFQQIDNRIKLPAELKDQLGLTLLGAVPTVRRKHIDKALLINNALPQAFVEAIRGVRTNVQFSSPEADAKAIVVTSAGPGEGKTLVCTNLAVALAQSGQRILLIDADMRRPSVHKRFGLSQEPGLSSMLAGSVKPSEAVRRTALGPLWVLPSGKTPSNPGELLGSARFRDFLAGLGEHFEWVLIDTPPVMVVSEAAIAAHLARKVIFVVGCEMTNRRTVLAALEQLDAAQAQVLGGVMNWVNIHRHGYYYAPYYRREYTKYYAASGT